MVQVAPDLRAAVADPAEPVAGHLARAGLRAVRQAMQGALDQVLDLVGQLHPTVGEELDPVVRGRIMTGRQHDPQLGAEVRGQVGHRRGGHHPEKQHVDAGTGQPGDHRGLEELAGRPRVAADHRKRAAAFGARRAEGPQAVHRTSRGHGQVHGQPGGQITTGNSADTVRTEQPGQAIHPRVVAVLAGWLAPGPLYALPSRSLAGPAPPAD
jgi:hypothetical protein